MNKPTNAIDQLKKLHAAQSIERKDINLKDYVTINALKTGVAVMELKGFMSKYVPKYDKPDKGQRGFFTMLYLTDGTKVGAFSEALYDFVSFFYSKAPGYSPDGRYFQFNLTGGDTILVDIQTVALDAGKSTYNFQIIGGEMTHQVEILFDPAQAGNMIGTTNMLALGASDAATDADPEDDEPSDETAPEVTRKVHPKK